MSCKTNWLHCCSTSNNVKYATLLHIIDNNALGLIEILNIREFKATNTIMG